MISLEATGVLGDGSESLGALTLETYPAFPVLSSHFYNSNTQPSPDSNPSCWLPAIHPTRELELNLDL